MRKTTQIQTTVLSGGRIEVVVPGLPVGARVELTICVLGPGSVEEVDLGVDPDTHFEGGPQATEEVSSDQVKAALAKISGTLKDGPSTRRDDR